MECLKVNRKIAVFWIWMILFSMILCGCGHNEEQIRTERDAERLKNGIYVLRSGIFYELETRGRIDEEDMIKMSHSGKSGMVWLCQDQSAIPEVHPGDQIVIKQHEALPEQIFFLRMEYCGVTMGMTMAQTAETGVYGLSGQRNRRLCKGTSAEKALTAMTENLETLRIDEIAGMKIYPEKINEFGHFMGLEPGGIYPVNIYEGSYFNRLKIKADTIVFKSLPDQCYVTEQYRYTKKGYAEIVLPKEMKTGYYYIGNVGMFQLLERDG